MNPTPSTTPAESPAMRAARALSDAGKLHRQPESLLKLREAAAIIDRETHAAQMLAALELIAEHPADDRGSRDEWSEAAAFTACQRFARETIETVRNGSTQPAPVAPTQSSELRESLKQTLFALESVLHLSGACLPPASVPELVKYANAARSTLERNP